MNRFIMHEILPWEVLRFYQLEYIFRKFHDEQQIFEMQIIQLYRLSSVITTLFI